jgi:transcriptional regulator with XRE-family HTH domain
MSELYLVLRSRLDGVVDWVYLDGKVVIDARARKGLGREALGAKLHIAAKTLERYEKRSRFPRAIIPALADELDIRIEQPLTEPLTATVRGPEADAGGEIALLRAALVEVLGKLDRILDLLEPRDAPAAGQAP